MFSGPTARIFTDCNHSENLACIRKPDQIVDVIKNYHLCINVGRMVRIHWIVQSNHNFNYCYHFIGENEFLGCNAQLISAFTFRLNPLTILLRTHI